jgi:hypothetical protein
MSGNTSARCSQPNRARARIPASGASRRTRVLLLGIVKHVQFGALVGAHRLEQHHGAFGSSGSSTRCGRHRSTAAGSGSRGLRLLDAQTPHRHPLVNTNALVARDLQVLERMAAVLARARQIVLKRNQHERRRCQELHKAAQRSLISRAAQGLSRWATGAVPPAPLLTSSLWTQSACM